MQTQDNTPMCYQRENTKNSVKNLSTAFQVVINPLDNQLGSWVSKRPSKPNLPDAPKPSKLLLQQGFLEPCLV